MSPARSSTPFLWTVYVLSPAAGWGVFHGAPAGAVGLAAVFAIWWIWLSGGKLPGLVAMAILVLVKLAAGSFLLVNRGMEAVYFADAQWAGPTEGSTDFPGRSFTRIDRRLAFGGPGEPDIPLYFFNDSSRFNFSQSTEPDRATLPFSAAWRGYQWSPSEQDSRTFYLRGRNLAAALLVDGAAIARLEPAREEALGKARWPAGARHLVVYVSSQSGGGRQFEAGFMAADGTRTPFSDANLVSKDFPPARLTIDSIVRYVSLAIDAVLIAILIGLAGMSLGRVGRRLWSPDRRSALVALSWVVSMAAAVFLSLGVAHRPILLEGGSEYLAYESAARDIALHGPLMLLGHPVGLAQPFFYQPLYPYVLAVVHLLFGEDLLGVYVVQWMMAFGVVLMVWRITRTLFGVMFGRMGLVLAGMFFVAKLVPLSRVLLNENLFIPLMTAWTLLMIHMTMSGAKTTVRAGIAQGLATLVRSTLVASWAFAVPVLMMALARTTRAAGTMPPGRKALRTVALMVGVAMAVASLATLRNAIVSHRFVAITNSLGANLYMGNQPPAGVGIIRGSDYNSMVLQFARSAPLLFVRNLVAKALYALGDFDPLVPGAGIAPALIATWCAALVGMSLAARDRVPEGLRGPIRALPAALALSQLLIVIVFFPHGYGDRLILPIYMLLLPYAALGAMRGLDFLVP